MYSEYELTRGAIQRMRPKDAYCQNLSKPTSNCLDHGLYCDTETFCIKGKVFSRYLPKIGDIIVGICKDRYRYTNDHSICRVVGFRNEPRADIYVELLLCLDTDLIGVRWSVSSLYFRLANPAELKLIEGA